MKLPIISSKQVIEALRSAGFEDAPKRGKGSHVAMVKRVREKKRLVIIPDRKSLPSGNLLNKPMAVRETNLTLDFIQT